MKPIKRALACLAATGILLSQPAAASVGRAGSASHDGEHLAGVPGAAVPALIAILAVVAVAVIASSNNNNDHNHPASP